MKNYYCLVAGMPDISPDDTKLSFTVSDFKANYLPELSEKDAKLVRLFFLQYDHQNLLEILEKGEDATFDDRGVFTQDELAEAIEKVKLGDELGRKLPSYIYSFIARYADLKEESDKLPEDVLASAYYQYALSCGNHFVKNWFAFNLNVNNILVALSARKYGFGATPYLVGDGEILDALATSGARDFGLGSELEYMDELMRINEMDNAMEKERKQDLLKWDWLDEQTFFHYFSVERLFAFLVKLSIVERWMVIDKEKGSEVFRGLIDKLKNEVEIPADYKK